MKTVSLVFGILAMVGMLIGFIPCFGFVNWVNIPFAIIGLIFSGLAMWRTKPNQPRGGALAGLILCGIAVIFGILRLIISGGIL